MGGQGSGRPRRVEAARCALHPEGQVVARGRRRTASGVKQLYQCTPPVGARHRFAVTVNAEGHAAAWSPPPPCPEHAGSKVVRNGTYGKSTAKPRQRYRCIPADGSKPHSFTPPLPRDHVHENEEHCDHCDELRGIHRGETAVARRHSWSTRVVARGLEQLAAGASYSEVSRWAQRVTGTRRTRRAATIDDEPQLDDIDTHNDEPPDDGQVDGQVVPRRRRPSQASKDSRNAWHIAADWVEAFSPVIYRPVDDQLRADAAAERARLDALIDAGKPLTRPQVVLVDDLPVYGKDLDARHRTRRDYGYYVLVLAELQWPAHTSDGGTADRGPLTKLRLVRAMAKSNMQAWRIVFDELGYPPDYIVADAGTGIASAIAAHFKAARTRFIPSLWHLGRAVDKALADTPGAFTLNPAGRTLIDPLDDHMRKLGRHSGVLDNAAAWSMWWDELFGILRTERLPADKVRRLRGRYEPAMAAVLDELARTPDVPVSTGGLETVMASQVKPLLAMRRTSFGNLERTNLLFDLVVARQHGAFDNLGDVAKQLRDDTQAHDGWTVALRTISDPRPARGTYSSLRDSTLLSNIARRRGVA